MTEAIMYKTVAGGVVPIASSELTTVPVEGLMDRAP